MGYTIIAFLLALLAVPVVLMLMAQLSELIALIVPDAAINAVFLLVVFCIYKLITAIAWLRRKK